MRARAFRSPQNQLRLCFLPRSSQTHMVNQGRFCCLPSEQHYMRARYGKSCVSSVNQCTYVAVFLLYATGSSLVLQCIPSVLYVLTLAATCTLRYRLCSVTYRQKSVLPLSRRRKTTVPFVPFVPFCSILFRVLVLPTKGYYTMGSLTIKGADRVLYGEKPAQNNYASAIYIFPGAICTYIALA